MPRHRNLEDHEIQEPMLGRAAPSPAPPDRNATFDDGVDMAGEVTVELLGLGTKLQVDQ